MTYEYGIISEPQGYSTSNNVYEMGWRFKVNQEFYMYGFRVKAPSAAQKICRLWNDNKTEIAQATVTSVAGEWAEVYFNEPIILTENTYYTISTQTNGTFYYNSASNFSFNSKITFVNGKAGTSYGVYPDVYTETQIYPMIDLILSVQQPYTERYLFADANNIYTMQNGTRVTLSETTLTSTLFENYGMEEAPDFEDFDDLTNAIIYYWNENEEETKIINAEMEATPTAQILISEDYDLTESTILGIEDADVRASSDVLFAISFDAGTTWKAHNGSAWVTLSSSDSGMNAETFNSISVEAWATAAAGADNFRIRAYIPALTSYIESIIINFLN